MGKRKRSRPTAGFEINCKGLVLDVDAYPSMIRHDVGVHVPDEHVKGPFPLLGEDGRVEGRLLTIDHYEAKKKRNPIVS